MHPPRNRARRRLRICGMSNPALTRQFGDGALDAKLQADAPGVAQDSKDHMTIGGVLSKTAFLFAVAVAAGAWGWANVEQINTLWWIILIVTIGVLIVTIVRPQLVRFTAPAYALAQGAMIGSISRVYEDLGEGVVFQAVLATVAVFTAMLFLYATRMIRVTRRLRSTIVLATVGVFLFYLASILLGLFGVNMPLVWDGGPISIIFSLLIIGVAAFNLLLEDRKSVV